MLDSEIRMRERQRETEREQNAHSMYLVSGREKTVAKRSRGSSFFHPFME